MNFNNGRNNGSNAVNVNTSFGTYYSDTSMLQVGAWNRQLSLKFSPCTGKDANGVNQYASDSNQQITTSLTQENATALIELYNEKVKPLVDARSGKDKASVVIGTNETRKILSLEYDSAVGAFVEIAWNVSDTGIASADTVLKHKLGQKKTYENYDPATGDGVEIIIEADLLTLVDKINKVKDLTPVVPHTINYNSANKAAYGQRNNGNGGDNGYGQQPSNNGPINGGLPVNQGNFTDFLPFN